jgi:hypothetical protein
MVPTMEVSDILSFLPNLDKVDQDKDLHIAHALSLRYRFPLSQYGDAGSKHLMGTSISSASLSATVRTKYTEVAHATGCVSTRCFLSGRTQPACLPTLVMDTFTTCFGKQIYHFVCPHCKHTREAALVFQ